MAFCEECFCCFGVSCCDASVLFEFEEGVFDEVSEFVEVLVVWGWVFTVLAGWDAGFYTFALAGFAQVVTVIGPISQKVSGWHVPDQVLRLGYIVGRPCRYDHLDGQSVAVDGHMELGVQAADCSPQALVPPFAPAA